MAKIILQSDEEGYMRFAAFVAMIACYWGVWKIVAAIYKMGAERG